MSMVTALQNDTAAISRDLLTAISAWRYEDIPPDVIERLKLLTLDALGVLAASAEQPDVCLLQRRLAAWSRGGSATALLGKIAMPPPFAALANGTAIHALDFDDIHDGARVHSFTVVLPALLALAQDRKPVSGQDFLLALAIGTELNARFGLAAPHCLSIGWHPSTVFGVLAATVASARLLNLDLERQLGALGFAHHLSAGSSESILSGAPSKRVGPGFAAQAAVMAASLADDGISGPKEPLTGRAGLFALQQRNLVDISALHDGLGRRWEILNYQFKAFPCCRCCHSAIVMGIDLHKQGIKLQDVREIEIALSKVNFETVGAPYDPLRNSASHAQFNVAFCFASAFLDGWVSIASFETPRFTDLSVVAITERVSTRIDETMPPGAMEPVRIHLTLHDGTVLHRNIGAGVPAFDDAALLTKYSNCMSEDFGASQEKAKQLAEMVLELDRQTDVSALIEAFPHLV